MCGIVGYIGNRDVKEVLFRSLQLLEHRGYDSVGIAMQEEETTETYICKCVGKVQELRKQCKEKGEFHCGMGHTRWATHGGVSKENAHPHKCGKVTLVHNGIIENYRELIDDYELQGMLSSKTDSEVVAALLAHFYDGDARKAIRRTVKKLKGTYALVIMFEDQPGSIYAIRNVSPIVVAKGEGGTLLTSDLTALGWFSKEYFIVPEYRILQMENGEMSLTDLDGRWELPEILTIDWEVSELGKKGYSFYMEKEIMEQPEVILATLEARIKNGLPDFSCDGLDDKLLLTCDKICIVACGTAMHAGLVAKALVKSILRMPIDVEVASEFLYSEPVINEKTLVIAISQSGETVDTLEATKYARLRGAKCLSILNVRGSAISRVSDYVIYTNAGPEIAVASTKAYTTQLTVLYLLVARMAHLRGVYTEMQVKEYVKQLKDVPNKIKEVLERKKEIHKVARRILEAKDLFMIGRGLDYSIIVEGSLKLKEVSYIHSEAYAAGELKHGPIALITTHTPVVALATQNKLLSKELSNIKEVSARGAEVVLFIKEALKGEVKEEYHMILLPDMEDRFMAFPASVALQLLAYYVSLDKGFDVDKPRNLAKVVTVE